MVEGFWDLTVMANRDELLLKSEALEVCKNGVVITDPSLWDNPIIYANPAFEKMTGYSRDEVIGRNCRFLQGSDRNQPALSSLRECLKAGKRFVGVLQNYRKDGEPFLNEVSISSIRDKTGNIINYVGVQSDVSHRAQLEEARITDENKSKLLAYVSHDFKTPLNSILGYAQMLINGMGGELTEKQEKFIRNIHTSSQHLLGMVNALLDAEAMRTGKISLAREPIEMQALITESIEMILHLARQKQVELYLDLQSEHRFIMADPSRMRQVLLNLFSNAIKYNKVGGTVIISLSDSDDKQWVIFQVQDTGIGIAEAHIPQLFTEFYRGKSLSREHEGTGLGLAFTKHLIELHGGDIMVQSKEGFGSTFTLRLPVALSASQ